MMEVPKVAPVTFPEPSIGATPILPLAQVPPPPSDSVFVNPRQIPSGPLIGDGKGFTVMVSYARQLPGVVYVIIVVPDVEPNNDPDNELMTAIPVDPLTHVPPVRPSLRLMIEPTQTLSGPDTATGIAYTVTVT
jgi:hypothetical protein